MTHLVRRCLQVFGLVALLGVWGGALAQEKVFDHFRTGFELTGGHNFVACESCHAGGQFAGTPTECVACHSVNGRTNAISKPVNHIHTSERCDSCHNTQEWQTVTRVDHHEVFGLCTNCHNGVMAPGKPVNHIPVTGECSDCHSDLSWQPVVFNHDLVVTDNCVTCHDGFKAIGKPANHIASQDQCDACHTNYMAFAPVLRVDHDYVQGTCFSCHNNQVAIGQPSTHIAIREPVCDACHTNTDMFTPVPVVNHDYVQGTCVSCHNNQVAIGQPSTHIAVREPVCDACHKNTTMFAPVPAADVDHDYVQGACFNCHNNLVAPGQPVTHRQVREPLCERCHSTEVWFPPVAIDPDLLVF
jgi:hypothetical protein